MSDAHNDLMALNKDLGKVDSRLAALEVKVGGLEGKVDAGFARLEAREGARDQEAVERAVRDKAIEAHMAQVCAAARLGMFLCKWVLPPGGFVALLVAGRMMGWW